MNVVRRAQAGLERTLDPCVAERGVLAGKENPALRTDDMLVQQRLLARVEERERASGKFVVVPHLRRPDLELLGNLRVDAGQVFQRLRHPLPSAPAIRVPSGSA